MLTIRQALKKIEDDIVQVLTESKEPLTQDQLFAKTKLQNTSEYGWSFALENLEKENKIKVAGVIYKGILQYKLI